MSATESPWQPPAGSPSEKLAAAESVYRLLLTGIRLLANEKGDLTPLSAAMAAIDVGIDITVASGALCVANRDHRSLGARF
jgi:hypothetical protein